MKNIVPAPPEPQRPPSSLPTWVLIPLGLLLLLLSVGCSREKLAAVLPSGLNPFPPPPKPLAEVLPGTWQFPCNGQQITVRFGRHGEMSMNIPVPQEARAALQFNDIWMGGRYQVAGDTVQMTLTDGRWAAMAAGQGMQNGHMVVSNYSENRLASCGKAPVWTRVAAAPEGPVSGEARDLAANDPPSSAQKPVAPAPAVSAEVQRWQTERERLAGVFSKLEARRRALDPKNTAQTAAFNKDAADYTRQVARLSEQQAALGAKKRGPVAVEGTIGGEISAGTKPSALAAASTPAAR